VNALLPIFGNINTVPFIGTNALWKRDALEAAGGFVAKYATEVSSFPYPFSFTC